MNVPLGEVVYFDGIASSSTGAAADADSTPTFEVFEEATDTDIGVGGNMTKRTGKTGNYRGSFTASSGNGFEIGKWYTVIGYATIGGIAVKGVLDRFRIVAAETQNGYPKTDADYIEGTDATDQIRDAVVSDATRLNAAALNALSSGSGAGAFSVSLTILQDDDLTLIPECDVILTTTSTSPSLNIYASGRTSANGIVTFQLDAGTYYIWRQKAAFNFTNPKTLTVDGAGNAVVS